MAQTVPKPLAPSAVNSLDAVQCTPAKAALPGQRPSIAWTAVIKDALIRHYGTLKCAAISMGEMDQGQLTRDLDSGKFKLERLEHCDDEAKAYIAAALYKAFPARDPKAIIRRAIRDAQRQLAEAAELLEAV